MRKSRHHVGFLEAPNDKSSFGSLRNSVRLLHDVRLAPAAGLRMQTPGG